MSIKRQPILFQKVKFQSDSWFLKSAYALLDTDAILHLGSYDQLLHVFDEMSSPINLLHNHSRNSLDVDSLRKQRLDDGKQSEKTPAMNILRRNTISEDPRNKRKNNRFSIDFNNSKGNCESSFQGSSYRVIHAVPLPNHSTRIAFIIDLSLSQSSLYFPNDSDNFSVPFDEKTDQSKRNSKTSIERSTQTFNKDQIQEYLIGHLGEELEPWDPIQEAYDSSPQKDSEIIKLSFPESSESDLYRIILKLKSCEDVYNWTNAVNVASYMRSSKAVILRNINNMKSSQNYEEKIQDLKIINKKLESELKSLRKEHKQITEKYEQRIREMYPAEELHDIIEEHEKALSEERSKRMQLEQELDAQKNKTMSLSTEIKKLQNDYEPAMGEYSTVKLRFEELNKKYISIEKEYYVLKAQLEKAQTMNRRLSAQVNQLSCIPETEDESHPGNRTVC